MNFKDVEKNNWGRKRAIRKWFHLTSKPLISFLRQLTGTRVSDMIRSLSSPLSVRVLWNFLLHTFSTGKLNTTCSGVTLSYYTFYETHPHTIITACYSTVQQQQQRLCFYSFTLLHHFHNFMMKWIKKRGNEWRRHREYEKPFSFSYHVAFLPLNTQQ